jgi:para-nitrobenzyl esterase
LRDLSAETLLGFGRNWGPVVDGYVLPDQLDKLYASHQMANVPLLAGWNANDGTPFPPFATTVDDFRAKAAQTYGDMAAQFLNRYPVSTDEDALEQSYAQRRDAVNAWQIYTLARADLGAGQPRTFLYYFAHVPPWYPDQHFIGQDPPSNFGAYHTVEQVYFYNTLNSIPRPYTDADRMLADVSSSYLVNFATSDDPNEGPEAGLPTWPALGQGGQQVLMLDDSIMPAPLPAKSALSFFDTFYAKKLGRPVPL